MRFASNAFVLVALLTPLGIASSAVQTAGSRSYAAICQAETISSASADPLIQVGLTTSQEAVEHDGGLNKWVATSTVKTVSAIATSCAGAGVSQLSANEETFS